jgi:hypothetical protein
MILELTKKGAEFTKHIPSIECFFSSKENVTVDRIRPDKITLIVPKGTTSDNVNAWMKELSSQIDKPNEHV